MKITFKIYQQPEADFEIDAEASDTVANLKAKIYASQGHEIGKQNILFSRVLADDRTLESYRISEKGFLVLMISRPRPRFPTPPPELKDYFNEQGEPIFSLAGLSDGSSSDASTLVPETTSAPASVSTFKYVPMSPPTSVPATTPAPVPATTTTSTFKYVPMSTSAPVPASASAPVASKSTFKYVPMSSSTRVPASTSTAVPATTSQQQQGGALGGTPGAGSGGLGDLAALRNDPGVAQFRELVTQNPELRQQFIQQIAEDNPGLALLLSQNPDMLSQLLGRVGGDGGARPGAPVARLNVTEAERGAIERLEALGFPKQAVIEAYFACDKNEELAANYLFDNA